MRCQLHPPGARGGGCVAGQVQQHPPELAHVGAHAQRRRHVDGDCRPAGGAGQLAHLVEERPQRHGLEVGRRPAGELQELVDHRLQVTDLALDPVHLLQPLRLPAERVAQQPRVELEPPQRIANLVRDAGQHHLHPFVARLERGARLLESLGQQTDLVARLDRHRRVEIAAPQPRRRLRPAG